MDVKFNNLETIHETRAYSRWGSIKLLTVDGKCGEARNVHML
jgi:hypothetical protein